MARARVPYIVRVSAASISVTSPTGRTTSLLMDRTNVAAPPPAFHGIYQVPHLPGGEAVPDVAFWVNLAEWVRAGYRVEPPFAPKPAPGRRDLEDTWDHLDRHGWAPPRRKKRPVVPARMPSRGDEAIRLSFYKQVVRDADLSNLTLPRLFVRQCEFRGADFQNTDLTESRLCWNDFIACDFRGADLSHCDLRASIFRDCKFGKATLGGADLRRSTVSRCTFRGAHTYGAIADYIYAEETDIEERLSPKQRDSMEWHEDPGEEPDS
jgi:hypothetical protein